MRQEGSEPDLRSEAASGRPIETVRAGGVALAVRRLGRGRRFVLLHGGPGLDHHVLLPLAVPLAKRFEVWLPDLPGHGGSGADRERRPDLRRTFERLARWLAALDGRTAVLAGHSLGAFLAREALLRGRLMPDAVVLISPPAGGRAGGSSVVRSRIGTSTPVEATDAADECRRSRAELLEFVRQDTVRPPSGAFLDAVADSMIRPPWRYGPLLRQLHRILQRPSARCPAVCPALVLCGALDVTTPPAQARAVAAATAGARLEVLPGVGHFPYADGSSAAAEAVLRFLDEVLPSQPASRRRT